MTFCTLTLIGFLAALPPNVRDAGRMEEFEKLIREYQPLEKKHFEAPYPDKPTTAQLIQRYEDWPGWRFLPRFVRLAETQPDDEAAFRCCQWIIDRTDIVGNSDARISSAEQHAWRILAAHHTHRPELHLLCLRAAGRIGSARETFLRGLLARNDLPRDSRGFATVALAELVAKKYEWIEGLELPHPPNEFADYLKSRDTAEYDKDLVPANGPRLKAEGISLFRDVLAGYADVKVTVSAPYFRRLKNLGDKAAKGLHALEYMTLGSDAPDITGKDLDGRALDLRKYRGQVVAVSFWFTGCGPCMGLVPREQQLVRTYRGKPFVLLGVAADESLATAQKTAAEHKMDWPCWFDGENGPIARDWNVLSWPMVYVLDKQGRIVAKNHGGPSLELEIDKALGEKP
jgi:thiol-disulfide isomerase/thioredoxin